MNCGVGRRHGWDPVLLWLWCRLAAIAPIEPLAWEPPCAVGVDLQNNQVQRKKEKKNGGNRVLGSESDLINLMGI